MLACIANTTQALNHGRLQLLEIDIGGQTRFFDSVKDESADISPVISLVSLQSEQQDSTFSLQPQAKLLAASISRYCAGYDAKSLLHMMDCRLAALNGLLRAAKGLPHPRLSPSLLLPRSSPCRSK